MWFQLQIEQCPRDEVEELSNVLENSGALSITLRDKNDDPILEPDVGSTPLWPEVNLFALFEHKDHCDSVQALLGMLNPHLIMQSSLVPNQDWQSIAMADFKPLCFGERLWICPSWHEAPDPNATNVILDPGLAFGTGTHPTTELCLRWLDTHALELKGKSVLDYGCGSGILAIAALKLGAGEVSAVDIDPQALIASRANAKTNNINDEQLTLALAEEAADSLAAVDILISNILLNPLISLNDRFESLMQDDGILVVTGLLNEQGSVLVESYEETFVLKQRIENKGWVLLVFRKRLK